MDGASDLSYKVVSPLRGSLDFGMGSQCLPPQHAQRRCMLGTPGSALGYVVSSLAGLGEDAPGPAARGECQAAAWKAALQNVAAKAATDKAGAKMPPRSLGPFDRGKRAALQKRRGNDGQAQGRWKRDLGKIPRARDAWRMPGCRLEGGATKAVRNHAQPTVDARSRRICPCRQGGANQKSRWV